VAVASAGPYPYANLQIINIYVLCIFFDISKCMRAQNFTATKSFIFLQRYWLTTQVVLHKCHKMAMCVCYYLGINIFLDGFVPTENLRFRETSLVFKVSETATEEEIKRLCCYDYPKMSKQLGRLINDTMLITEFHICTVPFLRATA